MKRDGVGRYICYWLLVTGAALIIGGLAVITLLTL